MLIMMDTPHQQLLHTVLLPCLPMVRVSWPEFPSLMKSFDKSTVGELLITK
jgi:hypothetical protein